MVKLGRFYGCHTDASLQTVNLRLYSKFHFTDCFISLSKKDDNSYYSGACFHILVCRCDINFNNVLFMVIFV